jgi:transcriptional regulator with XRE-family HTH domain
VPPRKYYPSTPFAKWLVHYAARNKITLVEMAERANLYRTTLYNYVQGSRHKPELNVIVRLSEYTGEPVEKLARLAGVAGYKAQESIDPHLQELTNIYNRLPGPMKRYLLLNARQLADSMKTISRPPVKGKKKA